MRNLASLDKLSIGDESAAGNPHLIIDVNRLEGLDCLDEREGFLAIGAMTRQRALERSEEVQRHYPLLAEAAPLLGHPATRNRGTVESSIAHAAPAAERAGRSHV